MLTLAQSIQAGALSNALFLAAGGQSPAAVASIMAELWPEIDAVTIATIVTVVYEGFSAGQALTEAGDGGIPVSTIPQIPTIPPQTVEAVLDVVPIVPFDVPQPTPTTVIPSVEIPFDVPLPTVSIDQFTEQLPAGILESEVTLPGRLADWIEANPDAVVPIADDRTAAVRVRGVFRGPQQGT